MNAARKRLVQHLWTATPGSQVVDLDLSEYPPSRLHALRIGGTVSVVGATISLYVSMYLADLEHLLALTGDVALSGNTYQVEFLPWARPTRVNDLLHIVPIWPPTLEPDMKLHCVANANTGDIRITSISLLMEPSPWQ